VWRSRSGPRPSWPGSSPWAWARWAPERFGTDRSPGARPDFIRFLETAWDEWQAEHGDIDALPTNWLVRNMRQVIPARSTAGSATTQRLRHPDHQGHLARGAELGRRRLTGAKLVAAERKPVFSLCRPRGHASTDVYCGYCFFNNARWRRSGSATTAPAASPCWTSTITT